LLKNMSPGRTPGLAERFSRVHLATRAAELPKYCRFGPMQASSPSALKRLVWKSRAKISTGETQSFSRSAPCSKLALTSALRTTS
jgi:hypothetical protein